MAGKPAVYNRNESLPKFAHGFVIIKTQKEST